MNDNEKFKYNSPPPITFRVGNEWTERNPNCKVSPPKDRYDFIMNQVKTVVREVEKRSQKHKSNCPLAIRVGRMRAMHGAELLPRFRQLCNQTDILAFDITGENPNVMLELGMAINAKACTPGRVFVFQQRTSDKHEVPSDLKGYFITFFELMPDKKTKCGLKLADGPGFKAALRTVIMDIARERGMWADYGLVDEENEQL